MKAIIVNSIVSFSRLAIEEFNEIAKFASQFETVNELKKFLNEDEYFAANQYDYYEINFESDKIQAISTETKNVILEIY